MSGILLKSLIFPLSMEKKIDVPVYIKSAKLKRVVVELEIAVRKPEEFRKIVVERDVNIDILTP